MTNTILLKRSSVQGKIPTTLQLSLGELALNTYDGKLYTHINNGADSISLLSGIPTFIGDATGSIAGTGTVSLTLASVNASIGTYNTFVVNSKGLITSASNSIGTSNYVYSSIQTLGGTAMLTIGTVAPTSTMGAQLWIATITPSATTSKINVVGLFSFYMYGNNNAFSGAIFRGSTCIGTERLEISNQSLNIFQLGWNLMDTPATTSPIVYSMRVGANNGAAWVIGKAYTGSWGETLDNNIYVLEEYK